MKKAKGREKAIEQAARRGMSRWGLSREWVGEDGRGVYKASRRCAMEAAMLLECWDDVLAGPAREQLRSSLDASCETEGVVAGAIGRLAHLITEADCFGWPVREHMRALRAGAPLRAPTGSAGTTRGG